MIFSFVTDTATLCVFDPSCLLHRLDDDADWWCWVEPELEEENKGNVAFIGVGEDGRYDVSLGESIGQPLCSVSIRVPSGRIFIGAGEEVTSDGMEPNGTRGGGFIEVPPGNYIVSVDRKDGQILLAIAAGGDGSNDLRTPLRI